MKLLALAACISGSCVLAATPDLCQLLEEYRLASSAAAQHSEVIALDTTNLWIDRLLAAGQAMPPSSCTPMVQHEAAAAALVLDRPADARLMLRLQADQASNSRARLGPTAALSTLSEARYRPSQDDIADARARRSAVLDEVASVHDFWSNPRPTPGRAFAADLLVRDAMDRPSASDRRAALESALARLEAATTIVNDSSLQTPLRQALMALTQETARTGSLDDLAAVIARAGDDVASRAHFAMSAMAQCNCNVETDSAVLALRRYIEERAPHPIVLLPLVQRDTLPLVKAAYTNASIDATEVERAVGALQRVRDTIAAVRALPLQAAPGTPAVLAPPGADTLQRIEADAAWDQFVLTRSRLRDPVRAAGYAIALIAIAPEDRRSADAQAWLRDNP